MLKYANIDLEIEVIGMPGKKKRVEGAAKRTGEAIEKDVKKGAKAVNNFGKGMRVRALNQLAPGEKEKAREKVFNEQKSQRIENAEREYDREALSYSGGAQSPMPSPPGVRREEKKAEQQAEKR
jgi:hypothetical protein